MLLNYHELTVDEDKNSPAKKKQFAVICAVMIFFIVHSTLTSGILQPLDVRQMNFPGGEFIYKYGNRDYAASMSLLHTVAADLKIKEKDHEDVMYNLYLDDPMKVTGRKQRFASGILLNGSTKTKNQESNKERKSVLMQKNDEIVDLTKKEREELPVQQLWDRLKYQSQELPSGKAAVVQFPFTNGFVSALVHSYKIFPGIRKYAKEHGARGTPVVITTCSIKESMCTHFVPLTNAEEFHLGQPDGDDYFATVGDKNSFVNWDGVRNMAWKIATFGQGSDVPKKGGATKDEL